MESEFWYLLDGTVVSVDKGTNVLMTLTKSHRQVKVRLVGIAIEQDGALANEAKEHLSEMAVSKRVEVLVNTDWLYQKNKPTEITGVLQLKDSGADVALSLITRGLARTNEPRPYTMSRYTFCKYREAESKARSDKIGIWQ